MSWTLKKKNCDTDKLESIAKNPKYTDRKKEITTTICSTQSVFEFEIKDSYGDGICCRFGVGKVKIKMDNTLVAEELGDYGSGKTFSFGECAPVPDNSCLTGSAFWKLEKDAFRNNRTVHRSRSRPDILTELLASEGERTTSFPKRRYAKNAQFTGGYDVMWSEEQEHAVKKMIGMFSFDTCRRDRKGADFLVGSCSDGWDYDGSACWKECPDWMVSLCISNSYQWTTITYMLLIHHTGIVWHR